MSTKSNSIPFKEYNSTIARYSDGNQIMEKEYKSILESETGEAIYEKQNPSFGAHSKLNVNVNMPVYNHIKGKINIEDQEVPVYKTFWQYKQPASTLFTDWTSAGLSHTKEAMSIRNLPLYGDKRLKDPTLVLSNINNIRNNFQRYGKEYLTSTNMLNSEAFSNGFSYEQGGKSTYRHSTKDVQNSIIHGTFGNKEDGDLYARNENVLRVDLPENFANTTLSSWQHTNPAFVILNPDKNMALRHRVQFGTFNLNSMKQTGISCLTADFGIIPKDYEYPQDIMNNTGEYPPVTNAEYYNINSPFYLKKQNAEGEGLYCSANTNYVTMPRNHMYPELDTSFPVGTSLNSVIMGNIMSPKLREFIQNTLHKYNRDFIFLNIYETEIKKQMRLHQSHSVGFDYKNVQKNSTMIKIEKIAPYLFQPENSERNNKNATSRIYNWINSMDENERYKYIFNLQRNLLTLQQDAPDVEFFITNLSIVKIGGKSSNQTDAGYVLCSELSESPIEIKNTGVFLLLPTMLSEDLFTVQPGDDPYCIHPDATYQENATNCGFRGPANMWQQRPQPGLTNPTFVPNMFDDTSNPNNFLYNLHNSYLGRNDYDAPTTF